MTSTDPYAPEVCKTFCSTTVYPIGSNISRSLIISDGQFFEAFVKVLKGPPTDLANFFEILVTKVLV